MARFWVGVACRKHVNKGEEGGFMQVCHGKPGPLQRMKAGDGVIYYSPTEAFGSKIPYRYFTAIGVVKAREPYSFAMSPDFIPWRRDVAFLPSQDASIQPLLENLLFIPDKRRWGFPFRRGCFEICKEDFRVIALAMGVDGEI